MRLPNQWVARIRSWQAKLLRDLTLQDPFVPQSALTPAVQAIVYGVVVLRLSEDRGLAPQGQLLHVSQQDQICQRLLAFLQNSPCRLLLEPFLGQAFEQTQIQGLSYFDAIADKPLRTLIHSFYSHENQGHENQGHENEGHENEGLGFPVSLLGQLYEQFLECRADPPLQNDPCPGKKTQFKKTRGIYYTPTELAQEMIASTLGQQLQNKTPQQVENLKILDPACGSGVFLLAAYGYLLDWHRDRYRGQPQLYQSRIYLDGRQEWQLTLAEKQRILLNSIYGVDLDPQALAITQLTLCLSLLENLSQSELQQVQNAAASRFGAWVRNLTHNFRCGNAIVGAHFSQAEPMALQSPTPLGSQPLNWPEAFPQVGRAGGFDLVVGNPPYIDSESMAHSRPAERLYCHQHYAAATGNWDLFCIFIERAFQLCKPGGLTSLVVPNKLGSAPYAQGARFMLTRANRLLAIQDYAKADIFAASVYPIVFVAQKAQPPRQAQVLYQKFVSQNSGLHAIATQTLDYQTHFSDPQRPWSIFTHSAGLQLITKLNQKFPKLHAVAQVLGAATVAEAYQLKALIQELDASQTRGAIKLVNSGTLDRYCLLWGQKRLRYLGTSYQHPVIVEDDQAQMPQKRLDQAQHAKIIVSSMTLILECALDVEGGILAGKSTSIIYSHWDLRILLGILNSKLITFCYRHLFGSHTLQGGYLCIGPPQLRLLPICQGEPAHFQRLIQLVEQMLLLQKQGTTSSTGADPLPNPQIQALDRQIDQIVYALYGLTDAEVAIVESG